MKNHKYFICRILYRTAAALLTICAALGWWGAIYPRFTLLQDTYEIVYEDDSVQCNENVVESELDSSELYWKILSSDTEHIRFRSRLFKDWNTLLEQRRGIHESGNQ
jgi:hypothetical protein